MSATIVKRADPTTAATRRVEGNRRCVVGTFAQPTAKYATGGFTISAAELGFDKMIEYIDAQAISQAGSTIVVLTRTSATSYTVKFYSALTPTELANESEVMKEKPIEFMAWGN